jgi:hypothetical protein
MGCRAPECDRLGGTEGDDLAQTLLLIRPNRGGSRGAESNRSRPLTCRMADQSVRELHGGSSPGIATPKREPAGSNQ